MKLHTSTWNQVTRANRGLAKIITIRAGSSHFKIFTERCSLSLVVVVLRHLPLICKSYDGLDVNKERISSHHTCSIVTDNVI